MKLLHTSTLFAAASAVNYNDYYGDDDGAPSTDTTTTTEALRLQGECTDEGKMVFTIPYTIPDSKVLKLQAGSCNEGSTAMFQFSQPDEEMAQLSLDIEGCGLAANRYEDQVAQRFLGAGAGYFTGSATVELGRFDSQHDEAYRFYNASLRTECGVATDYVASFDYGKISHITHVDDVLPGTYTEIKFEINASLDNFATDYNASQPARAGDTMYFAVAPVGGFLFDKYDFAVSSCVVQSGAEKVVLFDENSCENSFIDFTHQTLRSSGSQGYGFNMTHRLFVVGDGQFAEQNLTCNIKLCDKNDATSTCSKVFDLCKLQNTCECNGGQAVVGMECKNDGAIQCASCHVGHYQNGVACSENVCKCENGEGSVGTACAAHNMDHCKSCDFGYHGFASACVENVCSCDNGEGATNINCLNHNTNLCADCDSGYHLQNGMCVQNTCVCAYGDVSTDPCENDQENMCGACVDGYHLEGKDCKENVCYCDNGDVSDNCPEHDKNVCDTCNEGYYKFIDACKEKVCKCDNGNPVEAYDCAENGANQCETCNDGFYKDIMRNSCELNVCECYNGQFDYYKQCENNGDQLCKECNEGYHLFDDQFCEPNECECKDGTAVDSDKCSGHGVNSCKSCDDGYKLAGNDIKECEEIPQCADGYHFDEEIYGCSENFCECDHGLGATGEKCKNHGSFWCSSCNQGFTHHEDQTSSFCYIPVGP